MTTYTLSEARKHFSEIIENTQKEGSQFSITVNGNPAATILSQDDYESLIETLEILQDQEILNEIAASESEYKSGDIIALDDLS